MSSPGTSLSPVPGLRLLFEFVAFGHSALSGCSFFGSWCDSSWLVFSGGFELEIAEYFSGFDMEDQDVQVVMSIRIRAPACSRLLHRTLHLIWNIPEDDRTTGNRE